MHYYQFHIGDYRSATSHLSNEEDLAYRRLLDMYYDTESCIPLDTEWVSRRLRVDKQVVSVVLKDMFVETPEGWFHARCDAGIKDYHALVNRNRTNGKAGGRPKRNPDETQSVTTGKVTINHKPITIVEAKQSRGTRLPADWVPNEDQIQFCKTNRTDLSPQATADRFRDYWTAQAGSKGVKLDWDATWRNWVRAERVQPADKASGSRPSWDRRQR
jgi:uncharacterized protein YdaU (DUF1376 family)